jgi:site-specific DNA recombinase
MRVALYARVSTERQEKERTVGSQLDALQARAVTEAWAVEMTCTDEGYSGARLDRPGLDRVRDAAAAGLIDAVVSLCPDRLARNYVHQMIVLDELARFGVSLVFLDGGPAEGPQGRLMAQIQAAVAEFERVKIAERNRRGKLWRARQGSVVSGQVPFGYRKGPASNGLPARLVVCEEEAAVVRQIFDWHVKDRLSVRRIAIRLIESGVPTPRGRVRQWATSTLDRLLRQEAYAGTLYYNRRVELPPAARVPRGSQGHRPIRHDRPQEEWVGVAVPAIVDVDTWTRSQALHERNARFSPRHVGTDCYLLRCLVRCGECGQARASAGRTRRSSVNRYYRCNSLLPMHLREDRLRCSQPSARADELDQVVWAEVVRHLRRPELILQACTAPAGPSTGSGARRQLAGLRTQQRRLLDAYQAGAIALDDLESRQRALADRVAELERVVALEQSHRTTRADLEGRVSDFSQEVTAGLEDMTFSQRQALLRLVLEKVVVTDCRVELFFKIPLLAKECQRRPSEVSGLRSRCLTVAGVHPLGTPLAIAGAAHGVGLGRHQPLGEAAHHVTDKVGLVMLEVLAQPVERVQAVKGHRISPLGSSLSDFLEVGAVVVASGGSSARQGQGPTGLVHHSCGLKQGYSPASAIQPQG